MSNNGLVDALLRILRDGVRAYDLVALEMALRSAVPEFHPMDDAGVRHDATVVAFPARRARQ